MTPRRPFLGSLAVVFAVLFFMPPVALADNCSSLFDCFSTAAAAAAAAAGAGAVAGAAALPKPKRRNVDPCLAKQVALIAAIGLTILFFMFLYFLISRLPGLWATMVLGGPVGVLMAFLILFLVIATLSLLVFAVWAWVEYFRYRRLCP